jgi:exodeoxyribonuclease VII small subunit
MPDEPAPEPEPSFEQALGQLERIVASLERGEPELTAALAKYEKGVLLLKQCHRLLDQAEQSVDLLTGVDEEGNPLTAPFDAAATISREVTSAAPISAGAATTPLAKRKSSGRGSTPKSSPPTLDDPSSSSDPPF